MRWPSIDTLKLSDREKRLLQALAVLLLGALIYFLAIGPYIEFRKSSAEQVRNNLAGLNRMEELYGQYRDIKQRKTKYLTLLANRNDNITTLIEQWSGAADISRNIAYTRRTQSTIQNKYVRVTTDLKIEGAPIQKLIRFIYEIESSNILLRIGYLRVYHSLKGSDTYDVIMKIDSFSLQ